MLYFDRINVSERIDVNKTSTSKKCGICHFRYFLQYRFKFPPNVCNRYHDLLMIPMNLRDIAILNIKVSDYSYIISLISKNEDISIMQDADLTEKSGTLKKKKNLLSHMKMSKEILTFGDIEIEKSKFYRHKTPIFLKDVDIEKVLVSNKISFGELQVLFWLLV